MTFEFEYSGDHGFSTFIVDGVRISPEIIAALIHPRTDVWWRCKREGNLVIVEVKSEENGVRIEGQL
jgi:hypothetical protein